MGKKIAETNNQAADQQVQNQQQNKKKLSQFLPYDRYINLKEKKYKKCLSKAIKGISLNKLQIKKAVQSLIQFSKNHRNQTDLTGKDEIVYITVDVSKIPEHHSVKPIQIKLPFPIYSADSKSRYTIFVSDQIQQKLSETMDEVNVPMLRQLISYQKIKKDFKQLKDKKQLLAGNDLFFCDWKIYNLLRQPLGKLFYEQKKYPYPIDCSGQVPEHLKTAIPSYQQYINSLANYTYTMLGNGPVYGLKVAKTRMEVRQIVKNIMHATYSLIAHLLDNNLKPQNIRQICIKTYNSPSLPVYNFLSQQQINVYQSN